MLRKIAVTVALLVMAAAATPAIAKKGKGKKKSCKSVKTYKIPGGTFAVCATYGYWWGSKVRKGGLQHETIITPNGGKIHGFPRNPCTGQITGKHTFVEHFNSGEHGVFMITSSSICQWYRNEFHEIGFFGPEHRASRGYLIKTKHGPDLYLLDRSGNGTFTGFLYYDSWSFTNRGVWLMVGYHGSEEYGTSNIKITTSTKGKVTLTRGKTSSTFDIYSRTWTDTRSKNTWNAKVELYVLVE